jgi:hypothetical protein
MAYIICDKHGGNVAGLVSTKIATFILEHKKAIKEIIKKIRYIDKNKREYRFIVDTECFNLLSKKHQVNFALPITSEELMYEISLDFEPVCSKCLNSFLADSEK